MKGSRLRWLPILCLMALAGCAGYRLGPTNGTTAGSRTIQVRPFQNQTLQPRLIAELTTALRERLQEDGTYRLVTRGPADVVVTGSIVKFDRSALSFEPRDILTPRDLGLMLTAKVRAVERFSGDVLLDGEVSGYTTVRALSDLASAERQATPLLAEDLARRITALLVEGAW